MPPFEARPTPTCVAALAALLAAACSRGGAGAENGSSPAARRTSVVLIVIDTLRADFGRTGGAQAATPNLDRLAADGVVFPLAFSHAPMTLPSHTSLLASKSPGETLVLNNGDDVGKGLVLLPAHLAAQGYSTHGVVSLTTLCASRRPPRASWTGFDEFFVAGSHFAADGEDVNRDLLPLLDSLDPARPFFLFAHYSDPHEPYDAHGTADEVAEILLDGELAWTVPISDATQAELERTLGAGEHRVQVRSRSRFALRRLAWKAGGQELPCTPLVPLRGGPQTDVSFRLDVDEAAAGPCVLEIFVSEFVRGDELARRYAREVEFADRAAGELLDALRERGLYDSSLIVLTSDHGESLGERPRIGHVHTLFDEAMRVPLVLKLPAGSRAGPALRARAPSLASHLDLVPTMLAILDVPALPGQRGRSWLEEHPIEPVHFETHRPEAEHDLFGTRDERFKLIYVANQDRFELYDLTSDPGETRDVFDERGAERLAWQSDLRARAAALGRARRARPEPDAEKLETLRALGYVDGGDEPALDARTRE